MSEFQPIILTHPVTKATRRANTLADRVRFEFDGYKAPGKPAEPTALPEFGPASNPADYTVAEVKDYLSTADDAESARVLSLEASGQNRKSLVG